MISRTAVLGSKFSLTMNRMRSTVLLSIFARFASRVPSSLALFNAGSDFVKRKSCAGAAIVKPRR